MGTHMSCLSLDAFISGAATSLSVYSCYDFIAGSGENKKKKGPIPIHFDWWGLGDNTIADANKGAILYPLLVAGFAFLPFIKREHMARKRARALMEVEQEAAVMAENGKGPLGRLLRTKVMPHLHQTFFTRSATVMILALQYHAHQISLGEEEAAPANVVIRPIVIGYAAILAGHWLLGTMKLM